MSNVTIRDIARELGVDPSTVSSCLSGDPRRRISKKRIEEVRKKAEEMGYIPNMLASRIFRRNNKKYIGIVINTDLTGNASRIILEYILTEVAGRDDCDYAVLFTAGKSLDEAIKNGVGLGIKDFIITCYLRGYDLNLIDFKKLPQVNIYAANYYFDDTDFECPQVVKKMGFSRDEYYSMLINFLEKSGYGPVLMVKSLERGQTAEDNENIISFPIDDFAEPYVTGMDEYAPKILERIQGGRYRTLLLRDDAIAVGVMEKLLACGVKIPEDLALIGFDDAPFAPYAKVALSSTALLVKDNVRKLVANIISGDDMPDIVFQQPVLVLRDSVPADWDWSGISGNLKIVRGAK